MMSSIRWVLLLLAVKIFPILGNVLLNDCNDETTETTNTTPFRIEIQGGDLDYYLSLLTWKVTGIREGVVGQGEHPGGTDLYVENLCLDSNDCYIFDIEHDYEYGLSKDDDFFKIFYDGIITFQGDEFSSSTGTGRSMNFGGGCPSSTPSLSHFPSVLTSPPTIVPPPTYSPTESSTYSPSESSYPTSAAPVRPSGSQIQENEDGRLHFPFLNRTKVNKFRNSAVPDCTDLSGGCVVIPRTLSTPVPDWAGNIRFSHPTCSRNESGRGKRCKVNLPTTIKNVVEDDLKASLFPTFDETNVSTNDEPVAAIVTGDLNNDGHLDIVIGFELSPNEVWMNNADDTFNLLKIPQMEPSSRTLAIALGDLNDDGVLDIVIGNRDEPDQLLLSTNATTDYEVIDLNDTEVGGTSFTVTTAIALGDIDGDGNLDIVLGREGDKFTTILLNSEGVGRSYVETFPLLNLKLQENPKSALTVTAISIGDINNDEEVDIVLATDEKHENVILTNLGNVTFSNSALKGLDDERNAATALHLSDMDGNGLLDIVLGTRTSGGSADLLYMQYEKDKFTLSILPGGETDTADIALGDINGDGRVDILVQSIDAANHVLLNMGDGLYDQQIFPEQDGESSRVALGDLNDDGSLDVITGNTAGGVTVLMNNVNSDYKTVRFPSSTNEIRGRAVVLVDMNDDGILDVVVANEREDHEIFMIDDKGKYVSVRIPGDQEYSSYAIAVGDLNNDTRMDVVVGNYEGPNQIFMNKGDNTFDSPIILGGYTPTTSVAIGDLNNDGELDIVIGYLINDLKERLTNEVYYQINGNFTAKPAYRLPGFSTTNAIALGDFNSDGFLDIVTANEEQNQVLLNDKNKPFPTFRAIDLPGDVTATESVAVGNMDNDSEKTLDIVFGNRITTRVNNMVLNMGNDTFTSIELPGGEQQTQAITLGDFNGDNLVDIIVGNAIKADELLLQKNDGTFDVTPLPGGALRTYGIAVGDLDGDGYLEVVSVHLNISPQVNFYSSCPNGGARPFTGSWCFKCPSYTGRPSPILNYEQSACVECLPDILQEPGDGEQCLLNPCFLSERKLGSKTCDRCGGGTFYDSLLVRSEQNRSSWKLDRCVKCSQGTFTPEGTPAVNMCLDCVSGTKQPSVGQVECDNCTAGFFQTERGQRTCDSCMPGGYCSSRTSCGGGFIECAPGTYNEKPGQSSALACLPCGMGTFSTIKGANSSKVCQKCLGGSFGNETGSTTCELCRKGEFQREAGQTSCLKCAAGNFSNLMGLKECALCPNRLSSDIGSDSCRFCAEEYYLKETISEPSDLFNQATEYCQPCPPNAMCKKNTTIETMAVSKDYWRDSLLTATLTKCENAVCQGLNQTNTTNGRRLNSQTTDDLYCVDGHTGARCEVCTDRDTKFFSPDDGKCITCPRFSWILMVVIISILIGIVIFRVAASRYEPLGAFVTQCAVLVSNHTPQAKFKLVISFFQVFNTLTPVYGVRFDPMFSFVFKSLRLFDFNGFTQILPATCAGTMSTRLILTVTIPFGIMFIGYIVICIHALISRKTNGTSDLKTKLWGRILKFTIIFMYIVLPGSSRKIFDAYLCNSFAKNDMAMTRSSYLAADPILSCEDDSDYTSVLRLFWALFVIWPVMIPLLMFGLLWKIRRLVRAKRTTPLAEACSFLWRDYHEGNLYWEILDLYRKIFLTGFILLIDRAEGNTRILRLLVATGLSVLYFGFLMRVRPYKQAGNLDFAFVSNILLILCFIFGTVLHFCNGDDESCKTYISRGLNSFKASLLVVLMTVVMLVIILVFLCVFAIDAIHTPSVRVVNTGSKPNLELPGDCKFHAFFSHIWSTGQAKTHTAVRKMQLFLPGVRIWLDVDELTHVDQLEESVNSCVVIIIFYTKGYFRSKNCQREVYAAVTADKPIYLIYENDICDVEGMREECYKYCNKGENILEKVFANTPIPWLGNGGSSFAIESIKLVSIAILRHLPFYKRVPGQLEKGVKIAGECSQVKLPSPVDVLVCEDNVGARRIADEAKTYLPENGDSLNICDARLVLDEASKDYSPLLLGNTKYLLLYLDEDVFLDEDEEVSELVMMALGMGIQVLKVHELDYTRGACKFENFFNQTPEVLCDALYKDIAVPLYPLQEYRKASYCSLLAQMGANETGKQPPKHGFVISASLLLKTSLRNRRSPNTISAARERWAEN